ncbi:MAG: DUF1015 domain-containing protein [Chlorobiaceae bacterium]|nr:DUF1015 domain-containing protein [Chlorobiaceae bacterium]MBA4309050.1 DUF1015 domain-containing protein [Chlorobiaceae bacterium]
MAIIKPFAALRPEKNVAPLVASVPYDVVNTEEAAELAKGNPLSLLNVSRSEITLPETVDHYSDEVYKKANENLLRIKKDAPLIVEDKPSLYLYKLVMNGRAQTGIAATFSVDDYDNNIILKHEKTRKVKEDDRTKHIITTNAQTGPVFLTYKGIEKINKIVEEVTANENPIYDFTALDGVSHTVWILPEKFNSSLIDEIAKVEKLYIADGHHRAASASRARSAKRDANNSHTGNEEYNFFIGVLFPAEELKILSYNRVVLDLNEKTSIDFLNEVSEKFSVEKTLIKEPTSRNNFCMYLEGEWFLLKIRDSVLASNSLSNSVSDGLDVSILQNFLLNPILAIDDPRTNKRIDFVGGIRGTSELEKLVDSGKSKVAFSMYPVSVEDLMRISDAGEIMPPKSTWFEPKLRDGLLIHTI